MPPRKIKVEDLRRFVFISDPQVSPDGDRVAFVHTKIDYPNDGYQKHIWIWDRTIGKARQFTHGTGSDSYPRWSPDGESLLFLSSKREPEKKKPQLWVIPLSGGEARLAAEIEDAGISKPAWAPDSKRMLFLSRVWTEGKPDTDVVVVRHLRFKLNQVGVFEGRRTHLFAVRLGRKPKQLTEGDYDVEAAKWTANGGDIAFVANMEEDADTSLVRDVYYVSAKGGDPRKQTDGRHVISDLSLSSDGSSMAFLGHDRPDFSGKNTDIWVMPTEGGEMRNLTEGFGRSIGRGVGSDLRVGTPNPGAVWAPELDEIFFLTGSAPTANIYKVGVESSKVEQLTTGMNIEGFSFSSDGSVLVYTAMGATRPAELWVRDEKGERRVTRFNDRLLKGLQLSVPERYAFKNELGEDVDAWVMKPAGFEPGEKYPAVLEVHGGPRSIYGNAIYQEFHLLNAEGYVVLYTNPRGSGGYGEDYSAVLDGQWGEVDYRDLMAFLDDALERFDFIDAERLGVTGGSYGGYMTNWMVTQTDRFKAAVSCRSTCNRLSHHGYSDFGFAHGFSGNMGFPWKDEEKLMRQSPIRYAANVRTPTLLIHSENDLRCPMPGAEEFFVALKEVGVEAELVRFPDENHELSRSGKPKHREERFRHILRWFNKYLRQSGAKS
jgi:dipeptidyl aminopeptidase/acylaminoacyl peptidase